MDDEGLLDRIYEAGAIPELWPDVLREFDKAAGAAGSVLFVLRGQALNWTASPGLRELAATYLQSGFLGNDARTTRLVAANHSGFLSELDVFTPEEWEADPIRSQFWGPKGYGWGVATSVPTPTGDLIIFHGERRRDDGPPDGRVIGRLDRLRPHLARAALLSNRVAFERVQAATAALAAVGIPAAVLDNHGQALATNDLLDALNPAVVQARPRRLALANPAADSLLSSALARLATGVADGTTQSIPVPATALHPPMVVHLHPVRGVARDVFTRASAILLVTPVEVTDVPNASVLQGLFDLTAAEAKVARGLASGLTIGDIAVSHGTSATTVRNQVRAVFAKTGLHRQAELVGLLRGITPRR